jgi:hypothetical protein
VTELARAIYAEADYLWTTRRGPYRRGRVKIPTRRSWCLRRTRWAGAASTWRPYPWAA